MVDIKNNKIFQIIQIFQAYLHILQRTEQYTQQFPDSTPAQVLDSEPSMHKYAIFGRKK